MNNILPIAYKEALKALQDQAFAASAQLLAQNRFVMRAELEDAQRRMAVHPVECAQILNVVMKSDDPGLSIETMVEARAVRELAYFIEMDQCSGVI